MPASQSNVLKSASVSSCAQALVDALIESARDGIEADAQEIRRLCDHIVTDTQEILLSYPSIEPTPEQQTTFELLRAFAQSGSWTKRTDAYIEGGYVYEIGQGHGRSCFVTPSGKAYPSMLSILNSL